MALVLFLALPRREIAKNHLVRGVFITPGSLHALSGIRVRVERSEKRKASSSYGRDACRDRDPGWNNQESACCLGRKRKQELLTHLVPLHVWAERWAKLVARNEGTEIQEAQKASD